MLMVIYIEGKGGKVLGEEKEKLDEMKSSLLENVNEELKEGMKGIIWGLESMVKYMNEGKEKVEVEEVGKDGREVKKLMKEV